MKHDTGEKLPLRMFVMPLSLKYHKFILGPIHGEELMSMFNYPYLFPPIVRGDDRVVSDQVLSLWYNFVVSG